MELMFNKDRKGVTPVIAVLLLLMMTVAAAGGAYVWINSLQEQLRSQTQEEVESFDRSISMSDLSCYNEGGKGELRVLFKNSGDKALDLNPVDMEIRSLSTGSLEASLSRFGISLAEASREDDISVDASVGQSFSDVNTVAYYTIPVGTGEFESGDYYTVTFIFKDEDDYSVDGRCQVD